jgi:histidinol phosphatase-like enzyme (inositol monophosphatase family)
MTNAWIEGVEAALDAAGDVIRPYFRAGVTAEQKTDESPVTIADRRAEETLREVLAQRFPDYGILGEELPPHNQSARRVWVIDPIDGTRAFITGRPSFCTLVGLLEDGVPVFGAIDQPVTGERWLGGNGIARFRGPFGGRMGTRPGSDIAQAELSSTSPEMFGPHLPRIDRLKSLCRRIYWGGDAYAYGLLALGQIDIVVECNLKPWDWAALTPVIQAAGGVVTDWAGEKLHLGSDGSVLAAANPALHEAAVAALRLG